jgi:WD40 repeat protein
LPAAAQDARRFVPQLALTDLSPRKVAFAPGEATLLMVVNRHGWIDLFDVTNPGRAVKVTETFAGASDAGFSPDGTRIVSGGDDGTVRLWTLAIEARLAVAARVRDVREIHGCGSGAFRLTFTANPNGDSLCRRSTM